MRGDALDARRHARPFDLAYLDPPYNQHRYLANYHVWETLVRVGRARALRHRVQARRRPRRRAPERRSTAGATMPDALRRAIEARRRRRGRVLQRRGLGRRSTSCVECCAGRGARRGAGASTRQRYVGAQIGIHNPAGEKVGTVSHLRNVEHLVVAGAGGALPSIALDG